jgi:hypothetical protein
MFKTVEKLIRKRITTLRNNNSRLNELIANEYDSHNHDKPFDLIEKNRIKRFILKYKLRDIVLQDLRNEGIIRPH